jgi:YfiH family protein
VFVTTAAVVSEIKTDDRLWYWNTWQDLHYLTCSLLEDWQHGFFTQQFSPRSPESLIEVLQPEAKVTRLRQIHGNQVLTPSEIAIYCSEQEDKNSLAAGDGIISEAEAQSVWVASADCSPVLIGDRRNGQVAAVHAGWRGTALKIVPETIARFLAFGSELANLRIAIGPAIAGEVYQVDRQVAVEVGSTLFPETKADSPETILERLEQLPASPILPDSEPTKVRLDVRKVNAIQLQQLGIQPEQIAIAPHCTYQQPEYFFSYRRTNQKNVQWSGIVSKFVIPN